MREKKEKKSDWDSLLQFHNLLRFSSLSNVLCTKSNLIYSIFPQDLVAFFYLFIVLGGGAW